MRYLGAIAGVLLCLGGAAAHAWRWPVDEPVVAVEFGERVGDYVHRGVELSGGALPVYPVASGTVVTVVRESDARFGQGNVVVVDHDQSFRSVYAHLAPDQLPSIGEIVEPERPFAIAGRSGHIDRTALRLSIIDLRTGSFVNPRLILPDLVDIVRPRFIAVELVRNGFAVSASRETVVTPGTYSLEARILDTALVGGLAKGLFSIAVFADGQELFSLVLDELLVEADGSALGTPPISPAAVLSPDRRYVLAELVIGATPVDIEIVAGDFAGNERVWAGEVSGVSEDL